ncbi:MAG: HD domain-containing protein [Gammaproteobacteria bacterium]|nr:HD domain-containing protein [Gammaproteobacteria bacterium]MBU2477936.1 HD domain-containing protein [Gammaproteobacteria bacterium]
MTVENNSVRLRDGEIQVGQALAWPVYDNANKLLLREGYVISSQRQLDLLLERGMYRNLTAKELEAQKDNTPLPVEKINPFEIIRAASQRLDQVFQGLESGSPQVEERILRLVRDILGICTEMPDAAIGALHLCHETTYTLCHPIHQACLVTLIGKRLALDEPSTEALVAAALTANVGMRELQDQLYKQSSPPTDAQREEIRLHTLRSSELLMNAGIRNELWLNIVRQHHERPDGSGYPAHLKGDQILDAAQTLSLADQYCAMLSARADRDPLPPHEQLRTLFMQRGQDFSETICVALVKELGVFPPGTFVRLISGEVGVVVQRGENGIQPIVSTLISPRGGAYARPFRRNCTDKEFSVKESVRWQGGPLNLSLIWGFA